jgi:hypothetical protein
LLVLRFFLVRFCKIFVSVVAGGTRQNLSVVGLLFLAFSGSSAHHVIWLFNLLNSEVSFSLGRIWEGRIKDALDRLDQLVIKAHLKLAAEVSCPLSDSRPLKLPIVSAGPLQDSFSEELTIFELSSILQTSVGL